MSLVFTLDAVQFLHRWPVAVTGALDEPAHLATALLVVLVVARWPTTLRGRVLIGAALAASVVIDADHIPLYAGASTVAQGGRPFSHSLAAVTVLLLVGVAARGRWRSVFFGAGLGVALHFVRDVATGPGLPLFWPFDVTNLRLPYPLYVGLLALLGLIATLCAFRHGSRHRRPEVTFAAPAASG